MFKLFVLSVFVFYFLSVSSLAYNVILREEIEVGFPLRYYYRLYMGNPTYNFSWFPNGLIFDCLFAVVLSAIIYRAIKWVAPFLGFSSN